MTSSERPVGPGLGLLGGTCGNNDWRESFIERLIARGVPRECFFDPVVEGWNEQARAREERAKREAALLLFYVADPKEESSPLSAYAMVEATLAVCTQPARTVVVFEPSGISGHARKALEQTERVLRLQDPRAHHSSACRVAEAHWELETRADGLASGSKAHVCLLCAHEGRFRGPAETRVFWL